MSSAFPATASAVPPRSGSRAWAKFRRNRSAMLGAVIVLVFVVLAVLASVLANYDPLKVNFLAVRKPPSHLYWLGTDELGRDVAARLVHGTRVSLFVAFFTVLISLGIGLVIGGLSGYAGGLVDAALSRLLEVMQTFPLVFFLIALLSIVRVQSLWPLVIALALTRWTEVARLVRAEVLSLESREFVLAARALGASPARIIARHLIPNALGPALVVATFGVGSAILLETALSFLGIGVAPPTASWGELLTEAHRTLHHPGAWWLALFPGLAIASTVLAVNALGEAVRRSVDGRA